MQSGAVYPKQANRAVRAFKMAFRGLPAIYWPFVPLAFAIHPIWLSIPFTLSGFGRLVRFCFITTRAGVRACVRALAQVRAGA
jgi:hypothetical protein